ncbi:TcaA NTF2-like domain-containing protein [Rummeliibacillus sp. NPDC094406]|uniref:TcaA NTF2-like domain-containing protein n=1 Tax=Rummeliibacillus sp. NPDC094406 TaxID=3364511 RepID=UPI00380E2750
MKKWKLICSICIAASLIAACSNDSEKTSKEPAKTEAFTTETHKTTQSNKTDQSSTSSSYSQQPENSSNKPIVSGQKMTDIEIQKLSDFIAKYPVEYAKAVESGDFTPLANEYIMHDTKLYEDLLAEIPKKHKQGIQEKVNKVEISSIKRDSDTDFTVNTKEVIAKTQNSKKDTKVFHRKYKVYYNYVEGNDAQSFFQISEIKNVK